MMEEQKKITIKGGTMRLGSYPAELRPGSTESGGQEEAQQEAAR